MNGSAPKSPATGSQVFVRQKFRPNLAMVSFESRKSSKPIPATSRTTRSAKNPVPTRKPRSSALLRRPGFFGISYAPAFLRLDPVESRELELDDAFGKRRVAERGGVLLPVRQRPAREVLHDLPPSLVLRGLVEKEPGERGDRVDAL